MPLRLFALAALLAVATGCPGRTNIIQATQHLSISPIVAGGSFDGYTGTTFSEGIPTGKKVHLLGLTVSSSTGEFSWAGSLTGAANDAMTEVIVNKPSFAGVKGTTDLDIVDTGDLRSLFPEGNSFRLYWDFNYASTLAQQYPNGITVTFTYTIEIE
ncbi:MAG TPA: hypothetical protein VMI75_12880 [Polyangiaceae bacterium]|nr:hypothetical protein [Polyangiaceae bacterium]